MVTCSWDHLLNEDCKFSVVNRLQRCKLLSPAIYCPHSAQLSLSLGSHKSSGARRIRRREKLVLSLWLKIKSSDSRAKKVIADKGSDVSTQHNSCICLHIIARQVGGSWFNACSILSFIISLYPFFPETISPSFWISLEQEEYISSARCACCIKLFISVAGDQKTIEGIPVV